MKKELKGTPDAEVDLCRKMYATGVHNKAKLARIFEVTERTIYNWIGDKTRTVPYADKPSVKAALACQADYETGKYKQIELAEKYGVSQGCVSLWVRGLRVGQREAMKIAED